MGKKLAFWSVLGASIAILASWNANQSRTQPTSLSLDSKPEFLTTIPIDSADRLAQSIIVPEKPPRSRNAALSDVLSQPHFEKLSAGEVISINLIDKTSLDVRIRTSHQPDLSTDSWVTVGNIIGEPHGRVILSRYNNSLHGWVVGSVSGEYEIQSAGKPDQVTITEILPESRLECAVEALIAEADGLSSDPGFRELLPKPNRMEPKSSTSGTVQDVLFVYNDQARVSLGGATGDLSDDSALLAKMNSAIAAANVAYADSNIPLTLRSVGALAVNYPYPTTENLSRALSNLASSSDGQIDEVHAERDRTGADIVSFWIETNASGGLANVLTQENVHLKSTFNVVRAANPVSTFVHEVGHNQGNRHLRTGYSTVPTSWFPDSFAHQFSAAGNTYVTIMASTDETSAAGATRILQFSAPEILFLASPTGAANSADTARTVRATASVISDFFSPAGSKLALAVRGKSTLRTRKKRILLRGTIAGGEGKTQVRYRAKGIKGVKNAKIKNQKWTIRLPLKNRRTTVRIFALDASGEKTKSRRITITRR